MQFNSISFLFCFFPLFLAAYYIFPGKYRNIPLLLGSLVFYFLGVGTSFWKLELLIALTIVTYLMGITLGRFPRKWLLALDLVILAAVLVFFKLYDSGRHLPAGLSFYLFQMAAYLIDVLRKRVGNEKNFVRYATQMVMFTKLLSGPLMQPYDLRKQVSFRRYQPKEFHQGLRELILGLGLKVILANRLGGLWGQASVFGFESISTPFAWMALTSYAMQLYFDFFGYSLMAIGIGRMLGFQLPENFIEPYSSKSIGEFYRRWHASLGSWFREYLYIPLGGNRKGLLRTLLNTCIIWVLTGLWHGVGANYLLWAGFICFFIILERLFLGKFLNKSKVWCHFYVVFVILLSWLPFAVGDRAQMMMFLGRLFGFSGKALNPTDFIVWGKSYLGLLLAGVFFATPIPRFICRKLKDRVWADIFLFILFWAIIYFISTAAQDPFMYFDF